MKNKLVKRIAVFMTVAVMGMSVMACGNKAEEAAVSETVLTEEEYLAKTETLSQSLIDTMTQAQEKLTALEEDDVDGAKTFIEELKAPFVEFAALEAPEKYAEAQAKYKSGCEAMVAYLDLCVEMLAMDADSEVDAAEYTTKITELITTIQNDLSEAETMMNELSGSEAE